MQTAEIVHFPTQPAHRDAPAGHIPPSHNPPLRQELDMRGDWVPLTYIARLMGWQDRDLRTVASYVRELIDTKHFPPPSMRRRAGQLVQGADAVSPASRFERAPVDAWIFAHSRLADRNAHQRDRAAHVDALLASRCAALAGEAA